MSYQWSENPYLFVTVAVCVAVLLASFAAAFIAGLKIILLTDFYGSIDEQHSPWSERMGRRDARIHAQWQSAQFRTERTIIKYGSVTFVSFLALVFVILILFGNPA